MGAGNAAAFRLAGTSAARRPPFGCPACVLRGGARPGRRAAGAFGEHAAAAAFLAAALLAAFSALPTEASADAGAACPAGLVDAVRAATGSAACVTAQALDVLVERGWAASATAAAPLPLLPPAAPAARGAEPGEVAAPHVPGSGALTQAEREWLADNPVVRVAYEVRPPLEHAGASVMHLGGLAGAYAQRFAEFTGAEFAVSYTSDWTETVEAIAHGRADIAFMAVDAGTHSGAGGAVGFTEPHTVLASHLITLGIRGGADGGYDDDAAAPSGRGAPSHAHAALGVVRGHAAAEWMAGELPDADVVLFGDHAGAFEALRDGRIDYMVEAWPVAVHAASQLGVEGMRSKGHSGHYEHLSIAFSLDSPELRSILGKALQAVPDSDRLEMLADAVPGGATAAPPGGATAAPPGGATAAPPGGDTAAPPAAPPPIPPDSLAWLEDNPVIRVAYGHWPPLEYVDDRGRLGGLAAAYADRFAEHTGASFEPVHTHSWTDALSSVQDGRADMAFMAVRTGGLLRHMGFTDPHTVLPWDMITIGAARHYRRGHAQPLGRDCPRVRDRGVARRKVPRNKLRLVRRARTCVRRPRVWPHRRPHRVVAHGLAAGRGRRP